jgi:hypothetical protein
MQYFDSSSGNVLGTVDLSAGAMVRVITGEGGGRELQIRDATGKIFFLQAPNMETRDTWAHHIMRVLTGSSGQPTGLGESVNFSGDLIGQVDVVVPASFNHVPSESGAGDLTLKLMDGRTLRVAVPKDARAGVVLRAAGPLSKAPSKNLESTLSSVDDFLNRSNVPIVVPCCKSPVDDWSPALEVAVRGGYAAEGGAAGGGGASGEGSWKDRYDLDATEEDAGEVHKKKISTGLYDMAMLNRLGKMEETFRGELAGVWGLDDEDDLPDSLQELDFNDILTSGDTEAVRTAWLLIRLTGSEGYNPSTMKGTVAALVEHTIRSIQALENEYVKA